MKYACLVYHQEKELAAVSDAQLDALMNQCGAWVQSLESGGQHVFSAGLQSPHCATTLRYRGGDLSIVDGPFAETKEHLGGLTIIEARDLNEAIQIAAKFPAAHVGTVEIRPVFDSTLDLQDPLDQKLAASLQRVSQPKAGV